MDTIIPYALLCFTSFFTLTNPLGTMPVFLTMTNGLSDDERKHIIKRATIVSFVILVAFTLCGQFLFKFFGISTNGFRIAAGIIILKIGYDMLQARYSSAKLKEDEIKAYVNDISITPLSIPMLCGPGAIANGIILMDDAHTWELKATLITMIAVVYVISFLTLRLSTRLVKLIGETGNNVMMRLMGLILMVIAVECFVAHACKTAVYITRHKSKLSLECRPALSGDGYIFAISSMSFYPVQKSQFILRQLRKYFRFHITGTQFFFHFLNLCRNSWISFMFLESFKQIQFRIFFNLNTQII